ncbi:glutathionylspermidine synthase [Klebsiella pneumoniae]|nr:glutathionylspermidine synthase [Klebsiella pneumoniae]VAQ93586.1 glutathionylspermidine synthase [Klebsiella pneumoniae]
MCIHLNLMIFTKIIRGFISGKYIQVCTFTVGGNYGGTCLRGDSSLVVKKESDIEPLIVLKDKA